MHCLVVKSLSKNTRVKLILLGVKLGLIYGTWTLLPIPWGYLYPSLFAHLDKMPSEFSWHQRFCEYPPNTSACQSVWDSLLAQDWLADVFGESVTHCLSWKVTAQQHWQWAWVELVRHLSWLYRKCRNTVGLASRKERRDMGYACCLRRACKASGGSFVRSLLIYNAARFTGITAETSRAPRGFSPKQQPQRYQSSDQC